MKKISEYKKIHFIGINGVSMSTLAKFASQYCVVTGSDKCQNNEVSERLARHNINTYIGSNPKSVIGCDLVVYSGAIPFSDAELSFAYQNNIKLMERCEFLQLVAATCKKTIAVAGTHGKTTTSAMLMQIFKDCNQKFVAHIGGTVDGLDGGFIDMGRDYFITEACEYKKSLLALTPYISTILNAEFDHPDSYRDLEDIIDTFTQFANSTDYKVITTLPLRGVSHSKQILSQEGSCAGFSYYNIVCNDQQYSFDIALDGVYLSHINLHCAGFHNIQNATCAFGVAYMCGLPPKGIALALARFKGVRRRFEQKGKMATGASVIEDYAHHPSEITACIDTAKKLARGDLFVVFEPHTYSRTKKLLPEFCASFDEADRLVILPTYAARETADKGVDGLSLFDRLVERNIKNKKACSIRYEQSYEDAKTFLLRHTKPDDIVLIVGAGSIAQLAEDLIADLQKPN